MNRRRPCTEAVTTCGNGASPLPAVRPGELRPALRRNAAALFVAFLAALLAACGAVPRLPQGVYVWQRVWDPALSAAVAATPAFGSSLRVLALQLGPGEQRVEPEPDWDALRWTGLPVTLVVRIDGSRGDLATRLPQPQQTLNALLDRWREHGIAPANLEIDYDCATAQLAAYAQWLAALRAGLPAGIRLSITALPAWRGAAELDGVLATVDLSVLQVHAVRSPAQGLFDATLARRWVADWSRRSGARPFLVALPAYGARLKLDGDGAVIAVESEQRLAQRSADTRELVVDPQEVAALIATLEAQRYANLAGFVWFRLPRDGDERAWSLRTLRAVATAQPLRAELRVAVTPQPGGALDLSVHSDGTLDAPLPWQLRVHGDCGVGDGANGYALLRENGLLLQRQRGDAPVLRAGTSRRIGWLRCVDPAAVRVTPE
ncbi:MAG: DUF3142 domain-containing protein [Xanthomonadaceae bacterium]|nr:DUF3142 domain-containing protein [Xanthomonadaceae bacterium]